MKPKKTFSLLNYIVFAVLLLACAFAVFVVSRSPKAAPPLPFNTNALVSTTKLELFKLPPNPTLFQRATFWLISADMRLRGSKGASTSWSFGAMPRGRCGLQGMLNDCTHVSGTRYLMPLELAAGSFSFGHTNALNGPQFIAAVEGTLRQTGLGWWDPSSKSWRTERLAFLPFPEQKVILVLPETEVTNFLRTNGIDARQFSEPRKN